MEPVFFRIFDASGATTERTSVVAGFEPVRLVADRTFRKYRRVPASLFRQLLLDLQQLNA